MSACTIHLLIHGCSFFFRESKGEGSDSRQFRTKFLYYDKTNLLVSISSTVSSPTVDVANSSWALVVSPTPLDVLRHYHYHYQYHHHIYHSDPPPFSPPPDAAVLLTPRPGLRPSTIDPQSWLSTATSRWNNHILTCNKPLRYNLFGLRFRFWVGTKSRVKVTCLTTF